MLTHSIFVSVIILCAVGATAPTHSQPSVQPVGTSRCVQLGESAHETITIFNNRDRDLQFNIEKVQISPEHDPQDEAAGEDRLVASFRTSFDPGYYSSPIGWDYENDRIFRSVYYGTYIRVYIHSPDYRNFEEVGQWQIGQYSAMDGAWLNGILYVMNFQYWGENKMTRFDSEGNILDPLEFEFFPYAVAADFDHNWLFIQEIDGDNDPIHVYPVNDEGELGDQIGSIENHKQFHGDSTNYNLEWVPRFHEGKLWIVNYADENLYMIKVNEDTWKAEEVVEHFDVDITQPYDGVTWDGRHVWALGYNNTSMRIYADGVFEPFYVKLSPESGTIAAGDSAEITVTFDGSGLTSDLYEMKLRFTFDDPDLSPIEMSAVMSLATDVARIFGVVTDAATGEPVIGATASLDRYIIQRPTDENGTYDFSDLPLNSYIVTLTAPDYMAESDTITLAQADEDVEWNVKLTPHRRFLMESGWNSISSRFAPDDANITHIFSNLVNRHTLFIVKDQNGRFYLPERDYNGIGDWNKHQGYLANMTAADTLDWIGSEIAADDKIPLDAGWNLVAYLPRDTIAAADALHNITDILQIAKNGAGEFYIPGEGFSNMGPLYPGQGYLLKVGEGVDFVWYVP